VQKIELKSKYSKLKQRNKLKIIGLEVDDLEHVWLA